MLSDRIQPPRIAFDVWLDSLTRENRNVIMDWLTHPDSYSATAVAQAIRDDDPESNFTGYRGNHDTIKNWRRRNGFE